MIVFLVVIAFGLAALLVALRRAPEGHEDAEGFHYKENPALRRRTKDHAYRRRHREALRPV